MNLGKKIMVCLVLLFMAACNQPEIEIRDVGSWDEMRQAAYDSLSKEQKQQVDEGRFFFNGAGFERAPGLLERPDSISTLAGVSGFTCPREVENSTSEDYGTFFLYATDPGTASVPVSQASATFTLPPKSAIKLQDDGPGGEDDENAYVMLAGWPPVGSGPAFDAGLGYDGIGWYLFITAGANGGGANTIPYPEFIRLENIDSSKAAEVDFSITLSDGQVTATATPKAGSIWRNQSTGRAFSDPETGQALSVTTPIPGLRSDGIDNVISLQVDLGVDNVNPRKGSLVPDIGIHNLRVGDVPWDISANPETSINGFSVFCPSFEDLDGEPVWKDAYTVNEGNTAAGDKEDGLNIDINIKEENIHTPPANSIGLVIDDTGSMSSQLSAARSALSNFIAERSDSDADKVWLLATFKDSVNYLGSTRDASVIQSRVNSIFASGGGDCPENVLGAVNTVVNQLKTAARSGTKDIIVVTDASAQPGNVSGIINAAKLDNQRVHVFLSGDCGSGIGPLGSRTASEIATLASIPLSSQVVLKQIAEETGGSYYYLPGGSKQDYEDILNEIFTLIEEPSDTEPPVLSVTATPATLWPPNHKMKEINLEINVTDDADSEPQVELVGVVSTEPFDGQGDGNTTDDIDIREDGRIFVRAERSGSNNDRIYTITYKAIDISGNIGYGSAEVLVPHDKGKKR